jgi:endonuclease G
MVFNISIIAVLLVCLLGFSSCRQNTSHQQISCTTQQSTKSDTAISDKQENTLQPEWHSTSTAQSNVPKRIELPEVKNERWFIQHNHYAMEYDTAQRHSVWVAYVFHEDYNQKNVSRTDAWAFDPIIPKEFQSLSSKSQTYPSYDRGHLIASEDRVFSDLANRETFYFSNMSPQLGWFNQQIWKNLETAVRKWAKAADCDTLYVVTGGAINSGVEIIGKLENRNNVTIPKYYYKALVKRKVNSNGSDTFDGIAFWLENKRYESAKITHEYSMTIRELEQLTGINFFPNLKYVSSGLEEKVETTRDVKKWAL